MYIPVYVLLKRFPDISMYIFLNENAYISIKIPLKFAPTGPINNIPASVHKLLAPAMRKTIIWTNDG